MTYNERKRDRFPQAEQVQRSGRKSAHITRFPCSKCSNSVSESESNWHTHSNKDQEKIRGKSLRTNPTTPGFPEN